MLFLLGVDPHEPFPPVDQAETEPDGLLAIGGDLSPQRMLNAYRSGIFPWYSEGEPPLWWSPAQRAVFRTDAVHLSTRLRRRLRNSGWTVRADTAFAQVVDGCAAPRGNQDGTWITPEMRTAYLQMHQRGHAHSIEVFDGERLIGGLIGIAIGHLFCGDSMYSTESGASSLALAMLAQTLHGWGWPIIDSQVPNPHTQRLGVETWARPRYLEALAQLREQPLQPGQWTQRWGSRPASSLEH